MNVSMSVLDRPLLPTFSLNKTSPSTLRGIRVGQRSGQNQEHQRQRTIQNWHGYIHANWDLPGNWVDTTLAELKFGSQQQHYATKHDCGILTW